MTMRTKRILAALLAAMTVAAGCGGGDDGGGSGGSDETVLKWWVVTQAESANEAFENIIVDFEADNPDIKVDLELRAIDEHKDALRRSAGSSAGPDIYYMWAGPGLGGEFVESGVSLDISEYYEEYGWEERFPEGILTSYTQYGGYHGVPWTQRGEVIYYNKALFEDAGISSTPTTYDELEAAAQQLKDAGITPITFGGKDNWHVMRMLDVLIETSCGAEEGDALNTLEASWADNPCVDQAFTDLADWASTYFNEGFIGIAQTEAASLFLSGKAAMELEGDWFTQVAVDGGMNIEDVGVFEFPTGTDRLYGFTEGQYISASSEHPDEAAKFLDYLTSTEVQTEIAGVFAATSVNQEVTPSADANEVEKQMAQFITEAPGFYLNNDQNFPLEVTTEYWRIQNLVASGEMDPAVAGDEFQKFIDSHSS